MINDMKRGFTLIEMLVSVAIFTVVAVIALGALLSISTADKKAETLKTIMTNLNFAMDSMSRSIRTGANYDCITALPYSFSGTIVPTDCASPGAKSIVFLDARGHTVAFTSDPTQCPSGYNGCISRSVDGGAFAPITSPEVAIDSLTFYVVGSFPYPVGGVSACPTVAPVANDCTQARVLITVAGHVDVHNTGQVVDSTKSTFSLQTTVTQRIYDQ